jgi:hypothetical protein
MYYTENQYMYDLNLGHPILIFTKKGNPVNVSVKNSELVLQEIEGDTSFTLLYKGSSFEEVVNDVKSFIKESGTQVYKSSFLDYYI